MLEPGDVVDGIWVVDGHLGQGAMGTVFAAHHVTESRVRAAVKLLDPSVLGSDEARMRFAREGDVLTRVRHPSVVRVRGMRLDTELPYLEMELIEGRRLIDVIEDGPVPASQALAWIDQLLDGVRHLHTHRIAHRDIKPGNLLVTDDDTLVLVDFGLAVQLDEERVTQLGMRFGTAGYAPPEWMHEGRPDPERWDVYSCGVVLYELLTGSFAFPNPPDAGPRQAALQVMLDKQHVDALDPGDGQAETVRELVRSLTARAPERRVSAAAEALTRVRTVRFSRGELTDDPSIGALLRDLATPAPVRPAPEPTPPPPPPRPPTWWQGALVAYSVMLLAAAGVGVWLARV